MNNVLGISADLRYGCLRSPLRDRGTGMAMRGRFQDVDRWCSNSGSGNGEPRHGGPEMCSLGTTVRAHIPSTLCPAEPES